MDLIPVDHDPFAPVPGGYQLTPVDHDPFAEENTSAAGMIDQANAGLRRQRLDVFRDTVQQREGQRQADQAAMMPETYANPLARGLVGGLASMVADPVTRLIDEARNAPPAGMRREDFTDIPGDAQPGQELTNAAMAQAMGQLGAGWTGGAAKAGETLLGSGPIRAYHGSPHDFDRFDMSKIGTGEGAQAYGHGLYFAENEGVAKSYRDALAGTTIDGKPFNPANPLHQAAARIEEHGNRAAAIEETEKRIAADPGDDMHPRVLSMLLHRPEIPPITPAGGHMYEVGINAEPEHFLDWDKPLSQQSPEVMAKAANAYGVPQDKFHDLLFSRPRTPEDAAKLRDAGIPGIKYLDQGSRPARSLADTQQSVKYYGEMLKKEPNNQFAADQLKQYQSDLAKYDTGSRNYVVFNDKLIDILKKYGIAGAAATGMAKEIIDHHQQHFAPEQKS